MNASALALGKLSKIRLCFDAKFENFGALASVAAPAFPWSLPASQTGQTARHTASVYHNHNIVSPNFVFFIGNFG